ncbi:hypothetical protein [uncultured Mobiluncus sp.]|uniref:hypothetical protein n=1 Tax=uncultured Mobiluncus sp. TaxID=293425 RepID=UPI002889D298|nr:hypothetical protein [uncultured Mobiluncus sp.]
MSPPVLRETMGAALRFASLGMWLWNDARACDAAPAGMATSDVAWLSGGYEHR